MSEYVEKRWAAPASASLLPWILSLLCAACAQAPGGQQPDAQPRHPIALPNGRPSFATVPYAPGDGEPGLEQPGEGTELDDEAESEQGPAYAHDDDADEYDDSMESDSSWGTDDPESHWGPDDPESVIRAPESTEAPGQSDRDRDGVLDKHESKTGIFVDGSDTGTDPDNPDTDGDGLWDGDEVYGTWGGLDLPALGVSPVHRDLLLEYDWIDDIEECGQHSHRPSAVSLALVTSTFADAPIDNPDGKPGIKVIHDFGQGDPFTGGKNLSGVPTVIKGDATETAFQTHKTANMEANRVGYFHYVLMAHRYRTVDELGNDCVESSGNAEFPGSAFMVTLACTKSENVVAYTIMHELGHNLGLGHGGDEDRNDKPNYNSIMNYAYQFDGVDIDCNPGGDGWLDYSRNLLAPLQETALREPEGICDSVGWDWNNNGVIDREPVRVDVNADGELTELHDFDDWGLITRGNTLVRVAFVDTSASPLCPAPPSDF